jgi:hypothetical protein
MKPKYVTIEPQEHFSPTMNLRWKWKKKAISLGAQEHERIYEQMFQGNMGTIKWIEIPQGTDED